MITGNENDGWIKAKMKCAPFVLGILVYLIYYVFQIS